MTSFGAPQQLMNATSDADNGGLLAQVEEAEASFIVGVCAGQRLVDLRQSAISPRNLDGASPYTGLATGGDTGVRANEADQDRAFARVAG